jgi:hypothetical protein
VTFLHEVDQDSFVDKADVDICDFTEFIFEDRKNLIDDFGFVNKAILIYLMQKGHSPFKCDSKPKADEIADLLWWLITGKNKKDFQANRLRVYEIFESLSLPATPDCPAKTSNDAGTQVKNPLEDVLDYFPKDE